MEEKEYELRVIQVVLICDKCGEGEMVYEPPDPTLLVRGRLAFHVCNKCGAVKNLPPGTVYPYIKYERQ